MIVIAAALLGCLVGIGIARKRGGKRLDLWQYGAVYAIAFAILGLFVTIGVDRLAG